MRIRSIKPEFWRSDDIAALDAWDRLLFIGLWSYVDDNGVGRDQAAIIAADLFAHDLSIDPTETLHRVSQGLNRLSSASLIARYSAPHNGQRREFLEVTNWKRHQRIQNPGQARYPRSDADEATPTETLHTSSVEPTETLRPGAGDQGAGDQGAVNTAAADTDGQSETADSFELDHPEAPLPTTAELFKRFWSAYPRKDDKGKALEKFKTALGRASAEQIIAGAERYRDDPNRDPGYTKLPTTWLNADAWDNGPLPQRTPPQQFQSAAERRYAQGMSLVEDELREFYNQPQEIER